MNQQNLADFIWSAVDVLRGDFKQSIHGHIILLLSSDASLATRLLSDKSTRAVFLTVVYELLKKDAGADLLGQTRG